ncbi:MAG: hypothetical protein M3355_02810 [Actinomycetota bacterium]|nr:hypothetical protein [Actinomycetota bacterium]
MVCLEAADSYLQASAYATLAFDEVTERPAQATDLSADSQELGAEALDAVAAALSELTPAKNIDQAELVRDALEQLTAQVRAEAEAVRGAATGSTAPALEAFETTEIAVNTAIDAFEIVGAKSCVDLLREDAPALQRAGAKFTERTLQAHEAALRRILGSSARKRLMPTVSARPFK